MIQAVQVPSAPTTSLQELVLAAHFQAPLPLTVVDVADWANQFSDHPIVQQIQALPTTNLPSPGMPQMAFEIGIAGVSLPRILLRSSDGRYSMQLQGDRFAVGWQRVEPVGHPADYPGYGAMSLRWSEMLGRFEKWTTDRFQLRPKHRLAEINYVNAMPLDLGGKKIRISELFKFVQASGRPLTMFNVNWAERVYPEDPIEGQQRGFITASVGLGQAPPAIPVLAFNFAGLGTVAEGQESKVVMSDIHAKIREIYQSAIVQNAN